MTARGRFALVALAVLVIYLFAYAIKIGEENQDLQKENRKAIASLEATNKGIVDKLADVFAQTLAAEQAAKEAGTIPQATVEHIVQSLKGYVDPTLVAEALKRAKVAVKGDQGPAGPPGPTSMATASSTTTTTTTAPPAPSTTTTTMRRGPPTTTTTTRPCALGLLGSCLVR